MSHREHLHYLFLTPRQSDTALSDLIASTLREDGIEPLNDSADVRVGKSLLGTVQQAIERADLVIADLSGSNPNVMYEIGYAQALRKPVLPIVRAQEKQIPANLLGLQYLVYDPADPADLSRQLRNWTIRRVGESIRR